MRYWDTCRHFFGELRRDFLHTGAVMPSSRFLARAMTQPLREDRPPARILEVGPGTGAVTSEIVRSLRPDDQLDIVEINDHFVAIIKDRMAGERLFLRRRPQIQLIHAPVQDVADHQPYDFILSGLPMNNFPPQMVREIFRVFRKLLAPGGTLTFFEYILIRQVKTPFVNLRERRRLGQVGRIVGSYIREHQYHCVPVYANVPPAYVRHLRLSQAASGRLLNQKKRMKNGEPRTAH